MLRVSLIRLAVGTPTTTCSNPLRAFALALPFSHVDVSDDDNQHLTTNKVEEIVARCYGMMREFGINPKATEQRLVRGWIKTGDLGKLDANGRV
ncbi:MAG: AMP-binding protein [Bacteroidetes bacterium]|nr:AMP-binding protein [Bacteroidota bacterium]